MSQNEFVTMLEAASKTECRCKGKTATILIKAVWNNCLKCCSKYIKEAGKVVNGTTALIEAITWRHFDIVGLLLPIEGSIKDQDGKPAIYYAAKYCRELFDDVLKNNAPGFYDAIQEMRGRPCVCSARSESVKEALKNECMRCCALLIREAGVYLDEAIAEVKAIAACRSLIPVKIMRFLQARLGIEAGCTELILAIRNNLYDAAVLLVDEQRDLANIFGQKASTYAAAVHNPRLWALFQEDIGEEYVADLEAAQLVECTCKGKSESLSSAVSNNCLKCCARFIHGLELGFRGRTPLMTISKEIDIRIVQLLTHTQAGRQDEDGKSALMFAASRGNLPAVEVLAQKEAKLQDNDGMTALMLGCDNGYINIVQHMIPFEAGMRDNRGRTVLMYAIWSKRPDVARLLLPIERDITDAEGTGITDYAYSTDNIEIWRLVDPDITEEEGARKHQECLQRCVCGASSKDLISAAKKDCYRCCVKFKSQAGKIVGNTTAMNEAVINGNIGIVKLLMHAEAYVQSVSGYMALANAAYFGYLNIVELLMSMKQQISACDQIAIFTSAAKSKHAATLEYVLREMQPEAYRYFQEAKNSRCTCEGKSCSLKNAADGGCLKCATSFIHEAGDREEDPDILRAVRHGHIGVIKLLLPFEVGMRGQYGLTALMLAAQYGHSEIVKLLVPHEVKMQDSGGTTALMWSAHYDNTEIVKLLLPQEAGMTSHNGQTALLKSVAHYQKNCFDVLRRNFKELQVSEIPSYLFALYDGDFRTALEHRHEWISTFQNVPNALDFALLGGRHTFIRALMRDPKVSEQLIKRDDVSVRNNNEMVLRLLSNHENQHIFKHIFGVVCSAEVNDRSLLLSLGLFLYPGPAAWSLRPFCTPTEADFYMAANDFVDKSRIATYLRAVKNAGVAESIDTLSINTQSWADEVHSYFAANPLKQKQIRLVRKHAEKLHTEANRQRRNRMPDFGDFDWMDGGFFEVPEQKKYAWREVEPESAFNRALLLESRDLAWHTSSTPRLVHATNTNKIGYKQSRVSLLLVASYQFMYRVVQEMLDE